MSSTAKQTGAGSTPQHAPRNLCSLKRLFALESGNPVADIILVGDLANLPRKAWGLNGDFWPGKISKVDVYEFLYPTYKVDTRDEAVTALGRLISQKPLDDQARELGSAIKDPNRFNERRRAPNVILVGYGYGGILCEKVIEDAEQTSPVNGGVQGLVLFGTPHFSHGLRQWANIVIETTQPNTNASSLNSSGSMGGSMRGTIAKLLPRGPALSDDMRKPTGLEEEFNYISTMQRKFFDRTRKPQWRDRIVSCFPGLSPSNTELNLTILPEWSTIPHAIPVSIHKPYLEMTALGGDDKKEEQEEYKIISRLIMGWVNALDGKNNPSATQGKPSLGRQQSIGVAEGSKLVDKMRAVQINAGESKAT
ncbi:hypothetical protein F4808DRAFT_475991 [Astrocystis sublimbata]|nr:hypothetical protein F4808DRAFT_475991 [Astrocystis sublimbata]